MLTIVSIFDEYDNMTTRLPARRGVRRVLALAAGSAALLALSGCAALTGAGDTGGRVDVVTSFYPMEFLVERIGGRHVAVDTLTKPGAEPHDLELSPRQTGRLGEADVVVYVKGLQPAVDAAVAQSDVPHVVEATSLAAPDAPRDADGEHHDAHATDGDGHGHGAKDPHLWLDPVQYARVAQGVGKALGEADPDHRADYRRNTETLVRRLRALDREYAEGLADTTSRTLVTHHAAFGHLAARYGLREESLTGPDPESGASAARLRELHRIVAEEKVTTVFTEPLAGDKTVRTLAADLNLRTDVLDPLEGITDASRGDDYFEVMRANLTALRTALGAR